MPADDACNTGDRESPLVAEGAHGAPVAPAPAMREHVVSASLIDALPGIFYLYDEDGRFLDWNRNFERISGYERDEVAVMHPLDFFAGDERELLKERISEVFERGESSVEASFVTKSGGAIPHYFTGKRIVLGTKTCLIGVGLDISERRRMEQALRASEERYRTTLDNVLEGCQLLAFDWRYLYLNEAASVQNRRPNAELLGQRMPDAWPGIAGTDVFVMLKRCMEKRVAVHDEVSFAFADGETGWFDVRAQPVPEGIFVLSIDITERKRAELALRELNEGLERKVRERTLELEAARRRAERADELKSTFLATMSHELRTPLNSIIGFTTIISEGMAGPLTGEQSKQLGMVRGSAQHLLALINDLLDISKIEAGQLEICAAPFDLLESIERAVAYVKPLADKKQLSLHVIAPSSLEPMNSDGRRVEQVLLNLLNNAIKFTDKGAVEVRVEPVAAAPGAAGRCARIRVSDTGMGMKQQDLSRLFQPFQQIDAGLHRQHEGTGLGLAISRRLTELLGGSIAVESTWGVGSVFTVDLPMNRE